MSDDLKKLYDDISKFVMQKRAEFPAIVGFGICLDPGSKYLAFTVLTSRELSLGEQREFFQHIGDEFIKFKVVGDIVAQNVFPSNMSEKKWRLSGRAYGRFYNEELEFLEKKEIRVPREVLEGHLENVRKNRAGADFIQCRDKKLSEAEYIKLIEIREEAWFKTDKGESVIVAPRYAGSVLGSDDDGQGNTMCALFVNGEYVALAFYNETTKEIIAHEH